MRENTETNVDSIGRIFAVSMLTMVLRIAVTVATFSVLSGLVEYQAVAGTVVEKVHTPANMVYEAVGRGVDGELRVTLEKVRPDPVGMLVVGGENSVTWNVVVTRYEWERAKLLDDITVRQVKRE